MYEINGSAINSHAINGVGTTASFSASASGVWVDIEQSIQADASGVWVDIEQNVAKLASGVWVDIEQEIALRATASGVWVDIEQELKADASGVWVDIEQRIKDSTILADQTNVSRFGWDAYLTIGGVEVEPGKIHGMINVTRNENSAALMDVTLINLVGVQAIDEYHGKTVTLDVETASGITRIYTGVVDIPEIDLIYKRITLRCTDRRNEQINEQLGNQLKFIGNWSDAVFETPEDVAEELSQRLQTTTKTVDFDAYGNYTIADYLPKTTPDFILDDADIYRRTPQVQIASRGRLVNRINVEFEWRYTRLRHRERSFELIGPSFCDVMTTPGLAFLRTDSVQSNVEGSGWLLKPDTLDYEYLPDADWYNCGQGKFLWSPVTVSGTVTTVKDEDGNTVTDTNGNPVTEMTNKVVTNYQETFCISADWVSAKRFAQTVSEKITIQVNAPQSINQYGVIEQNQRNGYQVEYDATDFERNEDYKSPTGYSRPAVGWDYYLDKSGDVADYKAALSTVVAMAETKIIKSHRDNHVTLQTPVWPEVDLKHTVQTTAGVIAARGKVSQIDHTFDISRRFAETQVRFSLARALGSQSPESLTIPILNAPLVGGYQTGTLKMYTYKVPSGGLTSGAGTSGTSGLGYGANPEQETGMVTPGIDDESRNTQTVESSYTYNIALRNDPLTVTF